MDLIVSDFGRICLIQPSSDKGRNWLDNHPIGRNTFPEYLRIAACAGLVIEMRCPVDGFGAA